MALAKKPVTGMKDITPAEMQIREYVMDQIKDIQGIWIFTDRDSLRGAYREPDQQAGRG